MNGHTVDQDFVRESWEDADHARAYVAAVAAVGLWESERILMDRYLERGGAVLDIGCGAGRTTFGLYDAGYRRVTGYDLSATMIGAARRIARERGLPIPFDAALRRGGRLRGCPEVQLQLHNVGRPAARPLRGGGSMTQDLNERVELKTDRLLLRPFDLRDVEDVLAYASEPEFARYLPVPQPYTRDDAVEFVARQVLAEWSTRPAFAMVFDGHVVGGLGLRVDGRHERAELGYALARQHWGKGLTLEAAQAVVGWGFERYSLYKVYARADLRNRQSWRVMEKLGMVREGVLRSHDKPRDERVDDAYYGVLRDEWERA